MKIITRYNTDIDIFLRASQGHSWFVKAEHSLYTEITLGNEPNARQLAPLPECALHGTSWDAVISIMQTGLSCRAELQGKPWRFVRDDNVADISQLFGACASMVPAC